MVSDNTIKWILAIAVIVAGGIIIRNIVKAVAG